MLLFHHPEEIDFAELARIYSSMADMEGFLRREFFTQPEDTLAVWQEQGQYICALRLERYGDGLLLEALETAPNWRRQGYGTRLVEAALKTLPPLPVYAHVHRKNAASLALHRKCGFLKVRDSARLVDGTVTAAMVTLCRPCNAGEAVL